MFVLPPSHHHLASLHVAGVGNDGLWPVFNTTFYGSGGQGAGGGGVWGEDVPVGMYLFPLTGAQVPITSYTCTQPNLPAFTDDDQCAVSRGLRTCAIQEGARPNLLSSSATLRTRGLYAWDSNALPYPHPFVVLDIPQGWCVGSVKMTFIGQSSIPDLSLSVHSAERLSTNTDRTVFSLVSEDGTTPVVMNLTTLALGKYLRINMTEKTGRLYLGEIEVNGTSRYPFTDTRNLHDILTPLPTSLNLSSVTDDTICTHPSLAGGNPASPTTSVTPASPTTSVGSSTDSVTPISEYTMLVCVPMCIVSIAVCEYLCCATAVVSGFRVLFAHYNHLGA